MAPYKVVTSSQDLADIDLSKNYVLKTATGGYDGHGQKVIRSEEDLEEAYALADSADCVLEECCCGGYFPERGKPSRPCHFQTR